MPTYDRVASTSLGFDVGHHPLDGALGTGFSMAWMTDARAYWSVMTIGIFASMDLTYIFSTGLWHYDAPSLHELPFRIRLGDRLGIGISQSRTPPPSGASYQPTYVLVRPELESYIDIEIPFDGGRYAVFERTAVDTSVNLGELFRWSASLGLSYGFDFREQR